MEALNFQMRNTVLSLARGNKRRARNRIQSFLQTAYHTLPKEELEEFLRDVAVLEQDIEYL